jgi:CO dehydrogenase/acetyl-CoA synthase gamma subunit (corrinoid Fe-S protein)
MLFPDNVLRVLYHLGSFGFHGKRILYTAKCDNFYDFASVAMHLDGITLTLHNQSDIIDFENLNTEMQFNIKFWKKLSLRLNVFAGIDINHIDTHLWKVRDNIVWIDNCPVPKNEDLRKLKRLW